MNEMDDAVTSLIPYRTPGQAEENDDTPGAADAVMMGRSDPQTASRHESGVGNGA